MRIDISLLKVLGDAGLHVVGVAVPIVVGCRRFVDCLCDAYEKPHQRDSLMWQTVQVGDLLSFFKSGFEADERMIAIGIEHRNPWVLNEVKGVHRIP